MIGKLLNHMIWHCLPQHVARDWGLFHTPHILGTVCANQSPWIAFFQLIKNQKFYRNPIKNEDIWVTYQSRLVSCIFCSYPFWTWFHNMIGYGMALDSDLVNDYGSYWSVSSVLFHDFNVIETKVQTIFCCHERRTCGDLVFSIGASYKIKTNNMCQSCLLCSKE